MEKQNKRPVLRFPEFNSEWVERTLKEVGENIIGLTYSPKDVIEEGILVLRSSNIKEDSLDLNDQVRVSTTIPDKLKIKNGDILICTRNGSRRLIGKNVIIQDDSTDMTFGAFMSVFRSEMNLFIVHLLKTEWYNKQINMNLGARINQITTGQLNKFWFYFPPFPEQQKIASFFTAIDNKISQLRQKKTLLEQYKKGVMQKIFSQEIRFRDDNGQEFPKWEKKRLGEVATFSKGKGISKSDISIDGKTECIRYGELYTVYSETVDEVKSRTNINPKNLVLSEANDIIIPASGETQIDIATASCVLRSGIALGGDLNIIKSANNGVFLSYYLNTKKKRDIANLAQGISVVHLYSSQLSSLEINIPPITEQTKIANFLSAIDDKINHTQTQIEKAELWKKGLLQKMFV